MLVQVAAHRHHIGNEFINLGFQPVGSRHRTSWLMVSELCK
jgi:hypothetical protein